MHSVAKQPRAHGFGQFMLVEIFIACIIACLLIGGALVGEQVIAYSHIRLQIAQIARFDEAVADFHEKFGGLPGDLLSASAEREGLEYGDGSPEHSDGDGKISPCNLGWQWHLGCETALFWSQLSATGLLSDNFTADNRFTDMRYTSATILTPYLPVSPFADDILVSVWNSDIALPSPEPQLPYGNYYEITRLTGISHGKFIDDDHALTPAQADAIDKKMDDGLPYGGRIVANGKAHWPEDAWGTYAKAEATGCVAPDKSYNVHEFYTARRPLCHVAIALDCCDTKSDEP